MFLKSKANFESDNRETESFPLLEQVSNLFPRIDNMNDQLKSVMSNSEQDFLDIGGNLQNYLYRSRELYDISLKISGSITENVFKKAVSDLKGLLTGSSDFLSRSSKDIETEKEELWHIYRKIDAIIDNLGNFKKMVKQLRMLGISTKIESARLGETGAGFVVLAENVDELADFINEKTSAIAEKASFLLQEINNAIIELENLKTEQQNQSNIILNNTGSSLLIFEKKYDAAHIKATNIVSSSQNVAKSISSIVTSIQFHDINRQKMEHIHEAFDELKQELIVGTNNITDLAKASEQLGLAHDICELQSIQLTNACDEFVDAVLSIISNLKTVEVNVEDILDEIRSLLSDEASLSGNSLKEVQSELKSIKAGLIKNSEIAQRVESSINSVVEVVDNLARYISEIEEVGTEIEIIAVNAIIKAAKTGSNGLALGVLAEAIQKLSIGAKEHTQSTSEILSGISASSLNLKTNTSGNKQSGDMVTEQKIGELLTSLDGINLGMDGVLDKLQNKVSVLREEINSTTGNLVVHEQMRNTVSSIVDELSQIIMGLKSHAKLHSNRKTHTQYLMSKYTMHSERKIHQNFTAGSLTASRLNKKPEPDKGSDSFDDNVELF